MKNIILSIALTLTPTLSIMAMDAGPESRDNAVKKVTFSEPTTLNPTAMVRQKTPEEESYARAEGTWFPFSEKNGIDGFGASAIVIDVGFEHDASVNFFFADNTYILREKKEVSHGTVVSSLIASKVIKGCSSAVARGANVHPVSDVNRQDQWQDMNYQEIERNYEELITSLEHTQVLVRKMGLEEKARALHNEIIKLSMEKIEYMKSWLFEQKNRRDRTCHNIITGLIQTLYQCHVHHKPMPRVICMSIAWRFKPEEIFEMEFVSWLLETHDLLLVIAAGNDSNAEKKVKLGQETDPSESNKDILELLHQYPKALERILIVGAYDGVNIAKYSTQAGSLKDHYLVAGGSAYYRHTYREDGSVLHQGELCIGGTSFAAPKVAALAVILGKYFPHLSMKEIKQIILKTGFRPWGQEPNDCFGQGGIFPIAAWNQAILETEGRPSHL